MDTVLRNKLEQLPTSPGVYFHKDSSGEIIYIGKAANLRNRVRQYFHKSHISEPKTDLLVSEIADVDWTEVETEVDALFLEAELVRRYLPKYNILLRDDKSLSYVRIDIKSNYPTVRLTRRPIDDGAEYFGPFINGLALKKALHYLRRAFPYATTKPIGQRRASLHYHLGLDPGLEDGRTSLKDYRANLRRLMQYLRGNRITLTRSIEKDMNRAAKAKKFEEAVKLRNQLFSLQSLSRQVLFGDHEIQEANRDQALVELARILGLYEHTKPQLAQVDEMQGASEQQTESYERYVEGAAQLATPQFTARSGGMPSLTRQQDRPVRKLRKIEGFDISHIQGTDNVASMVVFKTGVPDKAAYRKFKMHRSGNDDFAHIHEVIKRRFKLDNLKKWGMPNLVIIDGGKGQLSSAILARDNANMGQVPMIGLAKRYEEIIVRKTDKVASLQSLVSSQSINLDQDFIKKIGGFIQDKGEFLIITLPENSLALKLLQRIRDESHRFAVSYHSTLRAKRQTKSLLEEIPGFGPVTRKKLIKHFGSLSKVASSTEMDISKVVGTKRAKLLVSHLDSSQK